jgi:hypothetical protein
MLRNQVSRLFCAGLATAGLTLAATPGFAQEDADMSPNQGAISFSVGADVVTTYVFRGYEQEDSGLIFQPYIELGVNVFETEDMSLDFYAGNWNSWHSEETGSDGDGPAWWYEADLYAGLSLSAFEYWTFDLAYIGYFYPGGSSDDIHELDFTVAFDDSWLWEEYAGFEFALNPYFLAAFEFDNRNGDDNSYGEFGLEPALTVIESEDYPVSISVPMAIGFSIDDYYADVDTGDEETFGFFSIGLAASTDLPFIPAAYGTWSASAGYTFFVLNDNAGLQDVDGGDTNHVGMLGVSMSY